MIDIQVISQQPPGGRCTLYAGYAEVLAHHLKASSGVVFSERRDAHGEGFPSLLVNSVALQPDDGAILMPVDIVSALIAQGIPEDTLQGLADALEAPLERLLNEPA